MINIGIITFQNGYNRGACDFYPLIKWKKQLRKRNIKIKFFKSHENKDLLKTNIIGIDSRYYRDLIITQNKFDNFQFIINAIQEFRSHNIKTVIFDNDDSSGGRQWNLIQYVDILLKKQILKNREFYTMDNGLYNYKPFVKSYGLDISADEYGHMPCPHDQLRKIKLGWNIGMKDYRYFPLSKYFPIGTSRLLNNIYKIPVFKRDSYTRPNDSSFRGEIKSGNEIYSYQRNKVIEFFKSNPTMISGGIITKRKYIKEMQNSKVVVSPFGWGEICYRDFEAILNGALLVKPDMEHIETYPDVYLKDETYISIRWDMEDLEATMKKILNNYEDYKSIIVRAQNKYKKSLVDSDQFINHFISALEIE